MADSMCSTCQTPQGQQSHSFPGRSPFPSIRSSQIWEITLLATVQGCFPSAGLRGDMEQLVSITGPNMHMLLSSVTPFSCSRQHCVNHQDISRWVCTLIFQADPLGSDSCLVCTQIDLLTCRVPDLRGKAFNCSVLSMMLATGLSSYMAVIMLRYIPSMSNLLRVFITNGC